jgi:hypothetical protein
MASVDSSEAAPKKKKGLLGSMNENLGLGSGADMIAPRLRPRAQEMGPIGMPFAADIALEQRKAQGLGGNLAGNPAVAATAKMTGRTKDQVISNAGRGGY